MSSFNNPINVDGLCPFCEHPDTMGACKIDVLDSGHYRAFNCNRKIKCPSNIRGEGGMSWKEKKEIMKREYPDLAIYERGEGYVAAPTQRRYVYIKKSGKGVADKDNYIYKIRCWSENYLNGFINKFTPMILSEYYNSDNPVFYYLRDLGIRSRDDIIVWERNEPNNLWYVHFLLTDNNGKVICVKERGLFNDPTKGVISLHDIDKNKYPKSKEMLLDNADGDRVFGLMELDLDKHIYLCEGEKDAAILPNAVGATSVTATGKAASILSELGLHKHGVSVVPHMDIKKGDDDTMEAREAIVEKRKREIYKGLSKNYIKGFIILPIGINDVGELYESDGNVDFIMDYWKAENTEEDDEKHHRRQKFPTEKKAAAVLFEKKDDVKTDKNDYMLIPKQAEVEPPKPKKEAKPKLPKVPKVKKIPQLKNLIGNEKGTNDYLTAIIHYGDEAVFDLLRIPYE